MGLSKYPEQGGNMTVAAELRTTERGYDVMWTKHQYKTLKALTLVGQQRAV